MEKIISGSNLSYDAGLRSFLIGVYNKIGLGLLITALMAYLASNDPLRELLFTGGPGTGQHVGYTMLGWIVGLGPLLLISSSLFTGVNKGSSSFMYWATTALFGLSLGTIVMRYTGVSIGTTFALTAAAFGSLSLFGYVTKINLGAIGNFLFIALIGLIAAMVLNVFIHSSIFALTINLLGVLIFAGFTAYDTQKLKEAYDPTIHSDDLALVSNMMALSLYLDFLNMFMFLLQFVGVARDDD
jgi:FtsH-binding integral membrane protein